MIREASIIVLAVAVVFSFIPLFSVFSNAYSLFLPVSFLLIVLSYAGYNAKKLIDNGEHNLAKGFILSLIVAMVLSMIAVHFILPFTYPRPIM
jgi:undecaprenyl pyrophosphate phosphatase UppP